MTTDLYNHMLIPLSASGCHTYRRSAGDRCGLSDFENCHQARAPSAVQSPKKVKSMTSGSFIVPHTTLLTRSYCDHLRSRCDSSTLSAHSYCALYALGEPKSPSLRFHYVLNPFTTCALLLRYVYVENSATSFRQLSVRHN